MELKLVTDIPRLITRRTTPVVALRPTRFATESPELNREHLVRMRLCAGMSAPRTGRLPFAVVGFALIVDTLVRSKNLTVPKVAQDAAATVFRSASSLQPKVKLNRSLVALRRQQPRMFLGLHAWLLQPQIRNLFSRKGHIATWHRWVRAAPKIQEGDLPTFALGMGPGRPRTIERSRYHDAALVAEFLHRLEGMQPEKALIRAIERLNTLEADRELDRRSVQRWRTRVRAINPSEAVLREEYAAIRSKYRF